MSSDTPDLTPPPPQVTTPYSAPPASAGTGTVRKRVVGLVLGLILAVIAAFVLYFLWVRTQVEAYYLPSESMTPTLHKGDRFLADKTAYRNGTLPKRGDIVVFDGPPEATDGQKGISFVKRIVALPGDTVQIKPAQIALDGERLNPLELEFLDVHSYLRNCLHIPDDTGIKIYPDHVTLEDGTTFSATQIAAKMGHPKSELVLTPGRLFVNGAPVEESYTREDPDYPYPFDGTPAPPLAPNQVFVLGDNRNRSKDSHIWGPLEVGRLTGRVLPPHTP